MSEYSVYALVHPGFPEKFNPFYVGLTSNPEQRLKQHLSKKKEWFQSFKEEFNPMCILESGLTLVKAKEREKHWIGQLEGKGYVLENVVHNEWAIRAREEEAQELVGLQRRYAHLPSKQSEAIIEITKGARNHLSYCAWDDAFDAALDTVRELEKNGLLIKPLNEVDVAIITLRRFNLVWSGEEAYNENV